MASADDPALAGERVSRDVPEPLREQVARVLREQIRAGQRTGRLDSEDGLAEQFGVSRKTIRSALAVLAGEGVVTSVRRLGWFVTPLSE